MPQTEPLSSSVPLPLCCTCLQYSVGFSEPWGVVKEETCWFLSFTFTSSYFLICFPSLPFSIVFTAGFNFLSNTRASHEGRLHQLPTISSVGAMYSKCSSPQKVVNKKLLGAPGIATNGARTLLEVPGCTRSKDATRNKKLGAPCATDRSTGGIESWASESFESWAPETLRLKISETLSLVSLQSTCLQSTRVAPS